MSVVDLRISVAMLCASVVSPPTALVDGLRSMTASGNSSWLELSLTFRFSGFNVSDVMAESKIDHDLMTQTVSMGVQKKGGELKIFKFALGSVRESISQIAGWLVSKRWGQKGNHMELVLLMKSSVRIQKREAETEKGKKSKGQEGDIL